MKKIRRKLAVPILLVAVLSIGYFVAPVRPAIAAWTADRYLQNKYPEYDFPAAEILSTGVHEFYCFQWITDYGAQSHNDRYGVWVQLNGWFPFIPQGSMLWQTGEGESVPLAP